jgi:pyridoxamine 5'-phosphate oxidase
MSEPLRRRDLHPDPLVQLRRWYDGAREAGIHEPEAMTLATSGPDGRPSARMVLMRGLGPEGIDVYTNRGSRKAAELEGSGRAALVLYWDALGRQIRVEGTVSAIGEDESAAYFATRPRGSRIAAWASPQSRPIADRAELEQRVADAEERFAGADVPLPPFWGGYRVTPDLVEFWQAGEYRLHDRFRYAPEGAAWRIERLGP